MADADVVIEEADPEAEVVQSCLRAYFAELDERFDSGFDAGRARSADGLHVVATRDGTPVGCGVLCVHGSGTAEIKRMWVARDARGTGLGRRLLGELEARAAASGAHRLRLDTNRALVEAIALYRSAGYREVEAFNDEVHAHHWFEKDLE